MRDAPGAETLDCANLSTREWKVSAKGGAIDIALRARNDGNDELPFSFHPTKKDEPALHGTHHVRRFESGVLVGFDAGEYGGALYFFSADGKTRQQLAAENVIGFAELGGQTIVVTGLAHLGMSTGKLLKVVHDSSGIRADSWIVLDGAADTFLEESGESMLVLTTGSLSRVTAQGSVNQIARVNYDVLYPNSMAADSRGVVYVGMRQLVVRWIPTDTSYREEWLTKDDCVQMQREKFECRCRGGA